MLFCCTFAKPCIQHEEPMQHSCVFISDFSCSRMYAARQPPTWGHTTPGWLISSTLQAATTMIWHMQLFGCTSSQGPQDIWMTPRAGGVRPVMMAICEFFPSNGNPVECHCPIAKGYFLVMSLLESMSPCRPCLLNSVQPAPLQTLQSAQMKVKMRMHCLLIQT